MIGKVISKIVTPVFGGSPETFDVILTLCGNEPLEFRIFEYEEKVAINFAKIGSNIEIELNYINRLQTLIAPSLSFRTI